MSLDAQSSDIAQGVDTAIEVRTGTSGEDILNGQGAGDQGMMFGYACDETDDLMPLPIWLAHRLAQRLAQVRKAGVLPYLRPDGKTQVTFEYEDGRPVRLKTVLISTQHGPDIDLETLLKPDLRDHVIAPLVPAEFADDSYEILANPTGQVRARRPPRRHRPDRAQDHRRHLRRDGPPRRRGVLRQGPLQGGPLGGLRGPLGGQARGRLGRGQALRDPGRLRHRRGPARCRSWSRPSGPRRSTRPSIEAAVHTIFDLRPAAIIRDLDLRRPIYRRTAAYGHFGRNEKEFTWEHTTRLDDFKRELGL